MSGGLQLWSDSCEKQVGFRVQTVLEDPQLLQLYKRFGAESLRRSSVFHGLDQFLRETKTRGSVCFEIGTWAGMTAVILSRYFEQVVTVDLDIYNNPMKHEVLRELGITNVKCVDIADNAEKARIAHGMQFDFAYMDGNHADDTLTDWEVCRPGGRVLMHEVWPWQAAVWELAHQLPRDEVTYNGMGLALWDGRK